MALHIRPLSAEEQQRLTHLSQSRTAAVRDVERARIILQASHGERVPAIARTLGICEPTVRLWIKRFNELGLAGLADAPHRGRPATYSQEQVGLVVATAPPTRRRWAKPSPAGRLRGWQSICMRPRGWR